MKKIIGRIIKKRLRNHIRMGMNLEQLLNNWYQLDIIKKEA